MYVSIFNAWLKLGCNRYFRISTLGLKTWNKILGKDLRVGFWTRSYHVFLILTYHFHFGFLWCILHPIFFQQFKFGVVPHKLLNLLLFLKLFWDFFSELKIFPRRKFQVSMSTISLNILQPTVLSSTSHPICVSDSMSGLLLYKYIILQAKERHTPSAAQPSR